jgi:hypothetical protein
MLVALCCVWNEAELLPGMLDSLGGTVDRVVAADGRYQWYPGETGASTDGTLDLLSGRVDTVIPAPEAGWSTEHEKRTALVSACEIGDMCLVVDADERLHAKPALRKRFGDYRLQIHGPAGFEVEAPRLFAYRPGLEYRWHFGLFTRRGRPVFNYAKARLPRETGWIEHRHDLRTPDRVRTDSEYEARLVPFERTLGAYG